VLIKKINELSLSFASQPSYSTIVKNGHKSATNSGQNSTKNVVIVSASDANVNKDGVENVFKTTLSKHKINASIKAIRRKADKIVIECDSNEDSENIIKSVQRENGDIIASKPKLKNPRIVVYNVSPEITNENIAKEIIIKNKKITSHFEANPDQDIDEHIVFKFEFKKRDNSGQVVTSGPKTVVLEISPEMRKLIINNMNLYIGYQSCRYTEYLQIIRCYKCNGFGHIAANCQAQDNSCGHCGNNHDSKCCDKKSPKFCVNCDKYNKTGKGQKRLKTDHSVFDEKCESFVRIKNIVNSRVNYG
jgi:hypothetical protein